MKITDLPFNRFIGLTVVDGNVQLQPDVDHENHLGTVHATAIFAVAEAASGQWLINSFSDLLAGHAAVLRSTNLKYRRPATARVVIVGSATCDESEIAKFSSQLSKRGRATIDLHVRVNQQGVECLAGTMGWFVLKDASS